MPTVIHREIEGLVINKTTVLPEGIIPESESFIVNAIRALDADKGKISLTIHGHAAGMLAQVMLNEADINSSPERQRAAAKEATLKLIEKYGVESFRFCGTNLNYHWKD